jgi:hypothetical protein
MDLTFVDVFEKYGLDAPVDSLSNAFARADIMLWHANQAARYNILRGIKAPAADFWINNPHADDIDYQIESDFSGLMSPLCLKPQLRSVTKSAYRELRRWLVWGYLRWYNVFSGIRIHGCEIHCQSRIVCNPREYQIQADDQ